MPICERSSSCHYVFNTSIRKLLKEFGVTAQREVEKAVRQAIAEHRRKGSERLPTKLTLSIPAVGLTHSIEDDIDLGWGIPRHVSHDGRVSRSQ
jgi:hypothetical protein